MKYPLIIIFTSLLLQACSKPVEVTAKPAPLVAVELVRLAESEPLLSFPSIAVATGKASLSFRLAGEVVKVHVRPGTKIQKGQLLAELDDNDFQLEVDDAQAQYNIANSKYRRSSKLLKQGYIAPSQLDELKAELRIAKARLDIAKLNLSFVQLKAPFSGVISHVDIKGFENVQVGETVMNIHRTDTIDIQLQAADMIYSKSPANKVEASRPKATVITPDGKRYSAVLKEFTTELDPSSGSFLITLTMPMPKDGFILDGTALDVSVDAEKLQIYQAGEFSVPLSAIFNEDGDGLTFKDTFVWVVDKNNRIEKRQIMTSKVVAGGVRLLKGLSEGERIVVAGGNRIRAGQEVRVLAANSLPTSTNNLSQSTDVTGAKNE